MRGINKNWTLGPWEKCSESVETLAKWTGKFSDYSQDLKLICKKANDGEPPLRRNYRPSDELNLNLRQCGFRSCISSREEVGVTGIHHQRDLHWLTIRGNRKWLNYPGIFRLPGTRVGEGGGKRKNVQKCRGYLSSRLRDLNQGFLSHLTCFVFSAVKVSFRVHSKR